MTRFYRLCIVAILMLRASDANADLILDFNPTPVSIVEGTTSVTFDIVLSQMAGEAFNGFTLALGVGNFGATQPTISSFSTTGGILDGTDFTHTVPPMGGGGIGQSEILINFTRAAGNTEELAANGTLASFTLDTTGTLAGQSFALNSNFGGASAAFDGGGTAIGLMPQPGTLNVTAVPEPSAFLFLGLIGTIFAGRVYFQSRRIRKT